MIATHMHAISKRLYAYLGAQGGMAQYSDGKAILSCPLNGGMMMPCGERDMPERKPLELKRAFLSVNHAKFDAMMFWPKDKPWKL